MTILKIKHLKIKNSPRATFVMTFENGDIHFGLSVCRKSDMFTKKTGIAFAIMSITDPAEHYPNNIYKEFELWSDRELAFYYMREMKRSFITSVNQNEKLPMLVLQDIIKQFNNDIDKLI